MKLKCLLLIIAQLLCTPALFALYSGNPADPLFSNRGIFFCDPCYWWIPKLGFQRDYIKDRKLETKSLPNTRVDEFEMTWDQAYIAISGCNRYEIYGTVGAGRLFMRTRPDNVTLSNFQTHRDYQSRDGTTWGIGGRAVVFEGCDWVIGVDGKYQEFFTKFEWDGLHQGELPTRARVDYREWQCSVGMAYNFCCLSPYANLNFAGLVHSRIKDVQSNPADAGTSTVDYYRLHHRCLVGLSFGTSAVAGENFYVNVEARIINERSLTLSGAIKF